MGQLAQAQMDKALKEEEKYQEAERARKAAEAVQSNSKKEKMAPKFEKVKEKVQVQKDEAADAFKKGAYADSIAKYLRAAEILENAYDSFGQLFKKDLAQLEAAIFNNIAFCYGRQEDDRKQIDFTSKVIERAPYLTDINVLLKAYLRRGLAYEHVEKYKLAINDLTRVRELQPYNKQAQQGI